MLPLPVGPIPLTMETAREVNVLQHTSFHGMLHKKTTVMLMQWFSKSGLRTPAGPQDCFSQNYWVFVLCPSSGILETTIKT
jgi:hypothetical protein